MGRTSTAICIDREKVYGALNRECMTMTDVSRDVGVHQNTISYWLKSGKVTKDNIDSFALAIGADPSEIKGKSSDEIGPEQRKYIDRNYTRTTESYWTRIDGQCFHALIIKNYKYMIHFAKHVGMSEPMIGNYVRWNKIPRQYERRFALALNVEPSEFVVDGPIDILEERDGKIEKVKNLVEAGSTFNEAAEEANIENVDASFTENPSLAAKALIFSDNHLKEIEEIDILRARIEELEKRLAKYEKPEYLSKHGEDNREMHHRVDSMMSVYFKEEGFTKNQIMDSVCGVDDLVIRLTDVACKNYVVVPEGKRLGFNRNRFVEVPDPSKYYKFYNDICSRFIEEFENSRSIN